MWEIREDGVRYCHCGSLTDAIRIRSMRPGRTIHEISVTGAKDSTVIDVSCSSSRDSVVLPGQKILQQEKEKLLQDNKNVALDL